MEAARRVAASAGTICFFFFVALSAMATETLQRIVHRIYQFFVPVRLWGMMLRNNLQKHYILIVGEYKLRYESRRESRGDKRNDSIMQVTVDTVNTLLSIGGSTISVALLKFGYNKYKEMRDRQERLEKLILQMEPLPDQITTIAKTQGEVVASIGTLRDNQDKMMRDHLRIIAITSSTLAQDDLARWETDADGNCIGVNASWEKLTGLPQGEALGLGWQRVIHPDDKPELVRIWTEAAHRGLPFEYTYRIKPLDGRPEIPVKASAQAYYDVDKRTIVGYLGVTRPR